MHANPAPQRVALYFLMIASGFAGLGYEMVWTRMLSVALGHEIVAALAVIGGFFAGLAVGAYAFDGMIRRSQVPGRWYAVLEVVIAAWALALVVLIPRINAALPHLTGPTPTPFVHWATAFFGTFLLLLPATAAMGATLPAMDRFFARLVHDGRSVAGLYAANTFGAVLGTLLTAFALLPALGLSRAAFVLAVTNLACAALMLGVFARHEAVREPVVQLVAEAPVTSRLVAILFLTGFVGIGYEVLVIRVLSQVLQNTVYTFACLLAVYLLGTSAGAALYQRFARGVQFETGLRWLLLATSLACLAGIAALSVSDSVSQYLLKRVGYGTGAASIAEFATALWVFLLPTLCMGATFSHLAQAARDTLGVGRALAVNVLGGALAPVIFGVLVLPVLGSKVALLAAAGAYLLLLLPLRGRAQWVPAAGLAAAILAFAVLLPPLRFVTVPPGGSLIDYQDGVMGAVAVVADPADTRFLKVNNHYTMGSTASGFSDRRQTHIPLLLHPDPRDVLLLGVGTGATFMATAEHSQVRAHGVELVPELLETLRYFVPSPEESGAADRLRVSSADARRYVQASEEQYDVVIAEVFHPSRDGAGSLYTVEHFEAVKARLRADGLFCQWLPIFQLDLDTLRTIVRTFLHVYPETQAYLAHYSLGQPLLALVGFEQPPDFSPHWLRTRVRDPRLAADLRQVRLDSDFALFGSFLANQQGLAAFAGSGSLNTDDRPFVTYRAPAFVYAPPEPAHVRLLQLVEALDATPAHLSARIASEDPDFSERLAAYWTARNAYLAAGVGVRPTGDANELLAQIEEPLLSVVRLSGDFLPAYQPLLGLAQQLHRQDPQRA
ncbi:MAG TPA: hypothetical protein VLT59_13770, partial [Steroidobacteraceae bacterium]|nr:hypothetical protein [Steroidobacteraceae bacterium]